MNIDKKGHTAILKDTDGNAAAFIESITKGYEDFKEQNLIIDISEEAGITLKSVLAFLPLAKKHRKAKKSFVVVAAGLDFNEVPEAINVVPTVQEA
ncbi:MAG TPA: ribonuclease Z, partial [Flavobacterium sp.]|nr:ribonuclease Z [Flavobacterium sp.]